jgi:alanine racemase
MKAMELSQNYAKINLDAFRSNYDHICQKAGRPVMAIIKADAYGHGAVKVAEALRSKCPFFGVSSVAEALELRQSGIETPILMLGHTLPGLFCHVVANDIRPAIFTYEDAEALSHEAVKQGKTAKLHLVVDTGMSRIGFQVSEESADICKRVRSHYKGEGV